MCIIIYKKAEAEFDIKLLRNAKDHNGSGFGIMFSENNQIHIEKGMFEIDKILELYEKYKNHDVMMHFRYATKGDKIAENCHPFEILDEKSGKGRALCLMHNGTLRDVVINDTKYSDTYHFCENYLKPLMIRDPNLIDDEEFRNLLSLSIGTTNKLLFLDNSGKVYLINREKGHEFSKDIWVSNESSLKEKIHKTTTTNTTTTTYHHHNHNAWNGWPTANTNDSWRGSASSSKANTVPANTNTPSKRNGFLYDEGLGLYYPDRGEKKMPNPADLDSTNRMYLSLSGKLKDQLGEIKIEPDIKKPFIADTTVSRTSVNIADKNRTGVITSSKREGFDTAEALIESFDFSGLRDIHKEYHTTWAMNSVISVNGIMAILKYCEFGTLLEFKIPLLNIDILFREHTRYENLKKFRVFFLENYKNWKSGDFMIQVSSARTNNICSSERRSFYSIHGIADALSTSGIRELLGGDSYFDHSSEMTGSLSIKGVPAKVQYYEWGTTLYFEVPTLGIKMQFCNPQIKNRNESHILFKEYLTKNWEKLVSTPVGRKSKNSWKHSLYAARNSKSSKMVKINIAEGEETTFHFA